MITKNSNQGGSGALTQSITTSGSNHILQSLLEHGIIKDSDVRDALDMNKKAPVLEVHPYRIYQGKGGDTRWFTYIADESAANGRRKVARKAEVDIYRMLYDHYFERRVDYYKEVCLSDLYSEWLRYKATLANRISYVRKIDSDYQKYYVNEPLSETILRKPLTKLTKIDMETWAHSIIKKYDLTKKAYFNLSIILRHSLSYLVDLGTIDESAYKRVKIDSSTFKKERKKPAETQIFFPDEAAAIVERAYQLAIEKQDENYLAIPFFLRSGIRLGECLGMRFQDFNKSTRIVTLCQTLVFEEELQKDGTWGARQHVIIPGLKGGVEERQVLVVQECFDIVEQVRKILQTKGVSRELVFSVSNPTLITKRLYRICDHLGIQKRSSHKARKTYISTLINEGLDLDFVREQVGHRDLKTTLDSYTYTTTRNEHALQRLEEIWG